MGSRLKDIAKGSLDIILSEIVPGKYQPKVKEKIFGTSNPYCDLEFVINVEKFVLGGVAVLGGFQAMMSCANMVVNPESANRTPEEIRMIGDIALKVVLAGSYVGVDGLLRGHDLAAYYKGSATSLIEFPYRGVEYLVNSVKNIFGGGKK